MRTLPLKLHVNVEKQQFNMPVCCIVKCGARKNENQPQLSLHRFPKKEGLKKKWLEAIGEENINPRHKEWYLCSLHFEESCFNRTLDVMRLHDNSVPTAFLIANEQDRKEAQNRERRRQCELERRSRIFNARNRKIGVDVPFLERQIAEKRAERSEQERKDLAFATQMIKDSNLAVVLEAREKEERRRIGVEIDSFRQKYQRFEDRREYDLNDPEVLKKQLPPRAGDDNPVGMSSAQKFEGEDMEYEERKKIMAAQKNSWLEQQVQERKAAQEERKKAEAAYMMAIKARDERAGELDKLERECRYRLGQANLKYNEALAAEKKQLEQILKEQEEADNTAEMFNNLTSDMLTENPDVAKSALGKNRAIGFMYKGMNQEELKKFYAAQKEQMAAAKAKRDALDKMEAEWQALAKSIQREVARQDIADTRKRREIARQLMDENQLMALQQKEKEKYFREVVYNNTPTDDYYSQFNTTTR